MKHGSASDKWIFSVFGVVALALAFTIVPSPVIIAQQAAASQLTPQKLNDADLPALPMSPVEKAEKDGTALRLSLKDVTKMALQNNLDIAIQDTNEQLAQQKLLGTYGNYDPTLRGTFALSSTKSANTNIASASNKASFSTTKNLPWNITFSQPVKTGGTLDATFQSSRQSSDQAFYTLNPNYNTSATVTFTQPLWRNFRIDSNRGNIKLANLDIETSDSQFKAKVTDTIANIQSKYWDLVSSILDYGIKRQSVRLAQITLRDNKKKVDVGTLALIEITQAEFSLAQRELSMLTSEQNILTQENALRQLISNDRKSEIWSKVIVPTDTPDFREYKVELNEAIETALKNRPELEQYAIKLKQSDINIKMAENSRKWGMDLQGKFGSSGSAGTPTFSNSNTPPEHIGGLGQAYKNLFSEGLINWQVQLTVNVPLRNRTVDAQIAQYQISRRQTLMNQRSSEQSIQVEIRNAVQQLETNRNQVRTAEVQRRLAQEQLDGEEKRFEAGLSENFRVLDQQNNLAQAANDYLVNLINYKKSIIVLQKAMYTLLESNEFEIAKDSYNNVPDLK
jgi:HAE1 family hydrophobic/amphiphilic exporter-1